MSETEEPTTPRPASSEDIPRAVEFLINTALRWFFYFVGAMFGLLALASWLKGWPWWVLTAALVLSLAAILLARTFRPRGKFIFDSHGPMVMVPRPKSTPPNSLQEPRS